MKSGLPYRWFQQIPAIKTAGLLVKAADGKAQINAKEHLVQFICHTGIPVRNGGKAAVKFSVRGKGKVQVVLSAYTRGENVSTLIFKGRRVSAYFTASAENKKETAVLPLDFGVRGRDIQLALLSFKVEKGSELTISDISCDVLPQTDKE